MSTRLDFQLSLSINAIAGCFVQCHFLSLSMIFQLTMIYANDCAINRKKIRRKQNLVQDSDKKV
jgi:hypothetical protein